jgi:hypothetical protein
MEHYGPLVKKPGDADAFDETLLYQSVSAVLPLTGATLTILGMSHASSGTISTPALTNASVKTRSKRWLNTSAATAGAVIFHRASILEFSRETGFTVVMAGGIGVLVAGQRWFLGIVDTTAAPTNVDPLAATTPGGIGLAFNTNAGNLKLINNLSGAARTVLDLPICPVNVTDIWQIELICPANGTITYIVTNQSTGAKVTGTLTANIPALTTLLGKQSWTTNNATAAACAADYKRLASKSDN